MLIPAPLPQSYQREPDECLAYQLLCAPCMEEDGGEGPLTVCLSSDGIIVVPIPGSITAEIPTHKHRHTITRSDT